MISKEIDTKSKEFANDIINTIREPLVVLDRDLRVIFAGRSFYDVFKVTPEETVGRFVYDIGNKQWDIPKLRELLENIIPNHATFDNYEVEHKFPLIGKRTMLLNARRIPPPPAKIDTILLAIEDVTDRKLSESASRLATVVHDSNDAITIQDTQGNITAWNKGAELMFGYTEQEALQMKVWQLAPPDKLAEQKDFNRRIFAGEKVSSFETQRLTKDGRLLDMWLTVTKLVDDAGKVVGIATTERDITEHEKKLRWRQDVNALQQQLLAIAPLDEKLRALTAGIVHTFDADFCRIWLIRQGDLCDKGCPHAEVKEGPHICSFRDKCLHLMSSSGRYTHIDGKGLARVPFGRYSIGLIASGEEHKFLTNDVVNDPRVYNHEWARELGLVSFAGYQLRIPDGELLGVMALFAKHPILQDEDATLDTLSNAASFVIQESIAGEKLLQSETMFKNIFNQAGDGILIVDSEDKKYTMCNKKICLMLGYSQEEIKNMEVMYVHPEKDTSSIIDQLEKQGEGKYNTSRDIPFKRKDGTVFYADINGSIVTIAQKKYIMELIHDTTERREIEDLKRMDKLKKDFISNMSHELRTPLNAVIGFSEILVDQKFGPLNDAQKDYLNDILESGKFLLSLINDILDFAKVESGKMKLELSDLSLKELLEGSFIFVKEKALKHNIEISVKIAKEVGNIRADERKVRQIVYNLLSNAVKFTPDGGKVGIKAEINGSEAKVTVWDTGIGISKEDQKKLFIAFVRLEAPLAKKYEGTGLGLSLAKDFVELHKGRIWVESEGVGKGSSFIFTLPTGVV